MTNVLFLNTRSAIGADVAVHLSLIRNLDPDRARVAVATNGRADDLAQMRRILNSVPHVHARVLNLGAEVAGRGKAAKLAGTAANTAVLGTSLLRLVRIVRQGGVDIIHTTDRPRDALAGSMLARLTGRKHLIHVHIKWFPEIGGVTTRALQRCDAVLAISDFVRRSLMEGGIEAGKIHTAYNATDPCEFDPERHQPGFLRSRAGIPSDAPLVGIVARIMVWKGHLELVEAMARVRKQVPNARLVIVGKEDRLAALSADSYEARVRSRIAELGLADSVHWAGWIDRMPEVFVDLDVAAVPSWEEPFGLVVTEAMAMERAVVGFESGALPEIVTNGVNGLLVRPKDPGELADGIVRLLRNPMLRSTLGRNGRRTVLARFTPRRQADEVATIYEAVASRQARVAGITRTSRLAPRDS